MEKVAGGDCTVTPRKALAVTASMNSVARLDMILPSWMAVSDAVSSMAIRTDAATTDTVTLDASTPVLVATACARAAFFASP